MEELPPVPPPAPLPTPVPLRSKSGFGDKDDDIVERKTLRDYYIILRERLWIALPVAVLVAVVFGYRQMRETPMYSSSVSIQWERADVVTGGKGIAQVDLQNEIDLQNKIRVLTSGLLEDLVRKSFTPAEIKILQQPYIDHGAKGDLGIPMGSKTINQQRASTTIDITVHHEGAQAAALVAQRFADVFIKYQNDYAGSKSGAGISTLTALVESATKDSEDAKQKLLAFKKENNFTSPTDARETVFAQIQLYNSDKSQTTLRRSGLEQTLKQIEAIQQATAQRNQRDLAKIPPNTPDYTLKQIELAHQVDRDLLQNSYIAGYAMISSLRGSLEDNEKQYRVLSDDLGDRHPTMIRLLAEHVQIEDQLQRKMVEAVTSLKADIARLADTEKADQVKLDEFNAQADRMDKLSVPYASLTSDVAAKGEALQKYQARLLDAKSTDAGETVPLRVLDRATVPGSPYTPDLGRITRTSVGLGLIVFVGLAVGLSFIDDRIKSAWDVEHFVGVNLLGIIPDLSSLKDEEKYTLVLNDSQATGTESFLSVYSSVKIHSKLDFPKSILVTSTIPGEGKTLISCNLAGSFARHSKRTLLIDCDLRRPMLHRHFRRENNKGLITWHEAGCPLEGDLTQDPTLGIIQIGPNFSLLCSGGRSRVPTEILESPQFAQLLERLKKMYDLVVIDSPPLGAVTDSLLIAERADEVIYVCRFNRAYKKHIRLHVKALRNGKNEILGVVLNGLSPRRIEYYSNYRYYRSYKKYYGAQT